MLVQVTASTRMRATRSLFSISSCSDIGAGKASAGPAIAETKTSRLSQRSKRVMGPPWWGNESTRSRARTVGRIMWPGRNDPMVNIYLFIELIHTANAASTVDTLKVLQMDNCKFANVVVLSEEKIVAQLDCKDSTDGDRAILNKIAKVDGVVQTNIIAVVRPVKR